ncbi:L,D-transpeptidase [Amycolatopsis sp. PS_44_ISF1]|uniref:L,D-transpeptidase n=1 Tax=Amycolatopsis sp. PS_44_ISF1 TaxID=2974917 RepID=UPI0028DF6BDD|nr:L,D-transpeptidase [Amycolatopsis sp. PS_44_ISF1]MDT8912895.1 L,D-transpeptidase [Amycolatopsis sp. PS_44_ISF1]
MKRSITAVVASAAAVAATLGFGASAEAAAGPPCSVQAKACVQLHTNTAWLMTRGSVSRGGVPVTVGLAAFPTPAGTFRVQYKDIDHYSKQFHGPMPYSVFFTNTGVAFHQGSLKVQSHGCVHLSHADAVAFFNALKPGDVVEVVK